MCLKSADFTFEEIPGEGWVGRGYKFLEIWGLRYDANYLGNYYKFNEWMSSKEYNIWSDEDIEVFNYCAGFHIFLKKDDAAQYRSKGTDGKLHPVLFKDVRCFGQNKVYGLKNPDKTYKTGPCVIAGQMKILDAIPFPWEKTIPISEDIKNVSIETSL